MTDESRPLILPPLSAAGPGTLYQQIVDGLKREVSEGRLRPGQPLPSFRQLAEDLLVSVITVKRAYEELEREGIIYRRQGLGTFVSERGHDRTRAAKRVSARASIAAGVHAGREGGMSDRELQQLLRDELKKSPSHEERHKEAS